MEFSIEGGVCKLDFELSKLEKQILDDCCNFLEEQDFKYLSIPSTIDLTTHLRQNIPVSTYCYTEVDALAGSSEQGILEYFTNRHIEESMKIYARNTCFRLEPDYFDLRKLKEFNKVEQFVFCTPEIADSYFNLLLDNACRFTEKYGIKYRVVDMTKVDPGYHLSKKDIEIWTEQFGWVETHSCTYFGEEQSRRFGITGANHTISCTGVATPRFLIPLIERKNK